MKRTILCLVALILMLCSASAWAASSDEALITDILRQADITQPVQLSQWGDTAACFAETEGIKRLILLERHNGAWQIVIDNPTALLQNADWPQLWMDSDNAVFWTYTLSNQEIVRYHSSRNADGNWNPVDQYFSDSGFGEYTHVWSTLWDDAHGGEIVRTFGMYSEDDNDHGIQLMEVLPATWMADCVRLDTFDVSRFPTMFIATNDHFATENDRFFREAAETLMPGYTFIKGMLKNGALHFLMEKLDGSRVYVICEYMSHREVRLIESTPLPAGTVLGHENFTDSLWIDGRCVSTFFNDIPYQIFWNAVERCRKRRKPSKGYIPSPDHGKTALTFTFDKKVHIPHIRGPPGHVERNDSLQHDQEAFLCEKCQ